MVHSVRKTEQKMPKLLGKNIQFCFSRPKTTQLSSLPPCPQTSKKKLLALYDIPSSSSTSKTFTPSSSTSDTDSTNTYTTTVPDFATVFASQRFFFSSPGSSNSIIDEPKQSQESKTFFAGAIPVRTYSPDPYIDFRQSMVEMVEARELFDVKADWDGLHELLLCYLSLNPKHTHHCIIAAFTDVLITLTSSSECGDPPRRHSDVSDYYSVSSQFGL